MARALPELSGIAHREVTVRGVRLHVAQAGSGPPLVLLHGWPQHWWSWRHLIGPLAAHYTVIAPDLRGWGWSEAPPGAYAKADFAADIVALLDHEGIDQARILGHDWGGYTAFLLALDHPERVSRMVALDISPPWPGRPSPRQIGLPVFLSYQFVLASPLGVPVLTRTPGFVRRLIALGSGPDMRWTRSELDAYAEVLRDPARARASSACYRTFLTRELAQSARERRPDQLTVPTLLIMGGSSGLHRLLRPRPTPRMEVRVIPRAGHFLPEEAPSAVLSLATPFFAGA
jgi:pimeloyl-ACP methyl ester carboxylesterase